MPNNKILLFGNANHQFNTNFVRWLRRKSNFTQIDIVSDRQVKHGAKGYYDFIFCINFIHLFFRLIKQIPYLRRVYSFLLFSLKLKGIGKYDAIHVQVLNLHALYFVLYFQMFFDAKIIISIWGSDYYKHSGKYRNIFLSACNAADKITFSNEQTVSHFRNQLNCSKDNIYICRFGLAPLEQLKEFGSMQRKEAKESLKWNKSKISITIGYNLNPAQQHIKILDQLSKLENYVDQIELIFPITYGGNKKYKKELLEKVRSLDFRFIVYDEFLTDEKIATIRYASDIMIQLQLTDQFSGSMQEHLYARNVVITGSWLPYQTMINSGINFISIDHVEDLAGRLEDVLKNYNSHFDNTKQNPDAVLNLSSWEQNISDWIRLYQ